MATAYTSLLGLALPVTGELSGTWGSTVNTEITALLDSAIAGTTTLSTDADVTLTTTTGAANTSRQAILLCSGARTVLRTITAPAQSKIYTIINATTGGFSVKLVGAGPTTGVTVVAGESAVCAWNGSDFIKISNTAGVGTFTNLTVTGTLGVTGVATFSAGTAALPAITTTGDTNTGIFFPAADTIAFSEGGAEAMRINSSGQVGIGTNSPSTKLTVYDATAPQVTFDNGTSTFIVGNNAGGNNKILYGTGAHPMIFYTNATEAARIDSSGNVGIGTTSPASKLESVGTITSTKSSTNQYLAYTMKNSTQNYSLYVDQDNTGTNSFSLFDTTSSQTALRYYPSTSGFWQFYTNNTERVRIDSSGNVGIGTTSPADRLDIRFATGTGNIKAGVISGNNVKLYNTTGDISFLSSDPSSDVILDSQRSIILKTATTERARIDSSGNLGIGTTSTTSVRLVVKGSTSNGTSNALKLIDSADADIMSMSTAGDFYLPKMGSSTGTTVVLTSANYLVKSSSSIRFKKDVEPIDIGLNFVLGLNPVKYKMKLDDANQVGFIAEDFPDERLVSFSLVNPQDKQSELQRESVNYANLAAPLVKAIQEQQALITQLTARITALETA